MLSPVEAPWSVNRGLRKARRHRNTADMSILISISNDGNDATFEYESSGTIPAGAIGQDQKLVIEGNGWYGSNDPPGYLDVDFISIK